MIKMFAASDRGLVRDSNQDCFALKMLASDCALAVVCDGMGGATGGDIASCEAVKEITEYVTSSFSPTLNGEQVQQLLFDAVGAANTRIYNLAQQDPNLEGMGTTVVAVIYSPPMLTVAHAGDSRLYVLGNGSITRVTEDHSVVQKLVNDGVITSEQARTHAQRHIITKALGIGANISADVARIEIAQGDKILICTDGLCGLVEDRRIYDIVSAGFDTAVRRLIDEAIDMGGTDNITVAVLVDEQ